jgi:hypothetical protein
MKKEFTSKLGRRVSERNSTSLPKKSSLLAIAVATSALVVATASYAFAETGQPMTEYAIFSGVKDLLTVTMETEDDDTAPLELLAARTMNLKVKGDHLNAGPNCPMITAKFIYRIDVVVISDNFDGEGAELGNLTIPTTANDGVTAVNLVNNVLAPTATVYDSSGVPVDNTVAAAAEITEAGIEVLVYVPVLTDATDEFGNPVEVVYMSGYTISIALAFNVTVDVDLLVGLEVSEIAWADEATVDTALIGL